MEKILLNLKEVMEITGWGETKTRQILRNPDYSFTLRVGNRLYVDRARFINFIKNCCEYNKAIN